MTTFTTEDRINAQKVEQLQAEVRELRIQLKHQKERTENWKNAYDKAMTYAKDLIKRGCDK